MKGQDNGIEIEVASDAPSNFIGTVEEDPSIAVSAGVDSDDGANLSSNSDRRSPRKKMFIKTALAATLVVVVTFSIGYVSGIRIRNATNNTNEALVSSAKNQAALQDVTGSAVGSKSSKDSKSAKDDLIKELLARVEALKEGQDLLADKVEALEDGQEALEEGQKAMEDGQEALEDGQEDLKEEQNLLANKVEALEDGQEDLKEEQNLLAGKVEALEDGQEDLKEEQNSLANKVEALEDVVVPCVGYISTARKCTIGEDAQVVAIEPSDNIRLSTAQDIRLSTTTGNLVADIATNIDLEFGQGPNSQAGAYLGTGPADLSSGSGIRVGKQSGSIELKSNNGDIKATSIDGSFLTNAGKNIDMIFGTASPTDVATTYIGTETDRDLDNGNAIRMTKGGTEEDIEILSKPGRVFIFSGTGGNGANKGYLTGTCERYTGDRKNVCRG